MTERAISEMTDEEILEYVKTKRTERETRHAESLKKRDKIAAAPRAAKVPKQDPNALSNEELEMMRAILGNTNES